mmetsp:Transcript_18209/g.45976  ORF Transcript_18209/g.45976 Transcript_18209/m.45976 type:complete len:222 (+) Transcript_18209:739-1404(+)
MPPPLAARRRPRRVPSRAPPLLPSLRLRPARPPHRKIRQPRPGPAPRRRGPVSSVDGRRRAPQSAGRRGADGPGAGRGGREHLPRGDSLRGGGAPRARLRDPGRGRAAAAVGVREAHAACGVRNGVDSDGDQGGREAAGRAVDAALRVQPGGVRGVRGGPRAERVRCAGEDVGDGGPEGVLLPAVPAAGRRWGGQARDGAHDRCDAKRSERGGVQLSLRGR